MPLKRLHNKQVLCKLQFLWKVMLGKSVNKKKEASLGTTEANLANRIVSVHIKLYRTEAVQWIKSHLCCTLYLNWLVSKT